MNDQNVPPISGQNFQPMNDQKLPNATAVLVLGILSILGSCCYALPGLIMGIIGLVLAKKDEKMYKENPTMFSNYSNLNTGKILSIIGIVLGVLFLLAIIISIGVVGWDAIQNPEIMQERMREMQNQ